MQKFYNILLIVVLIVAAVVVTVLLLLLYVHELSQPGSLVERCLIYNIANQRELRIKISGVNLEIRQGSPRVCIYVHRGCQLEAQIRNSTLIVWAPRIVLPLYTLLL